MIELTKRMKMVADCVSKGSKIADVGCDHAYLSIDLIRRGIAKSCIASDVHTGPLIRAEENIKNYGLSDRITLRQSNGLKHIKPNEVDSIIMAGMGGALMIKILSEGSSCTNETTELILQPQSEIGKVRTYLHNTGFQILFEDMCIDAGKYYVVIKARKKDQKEDLIQKEIIDRDIFEEYGEYLLTCRHSVLKEFLLHRKEYIKRLSEELSLSSTKKATDRYQQLEQELFNIQRALVWFDKE